MEMRSEYDLLLVTDNLVIIADRGTGGRSIAHDARLVAERLAMDVGRLARRRRIFYRNTDGSFGEILFRLNEYKGVRDCSVSQQLYIDSLLNGGVVVGFGQRQGISNNTGERD
ncbi:hypothetical protein [Halomonas heilongjiangensis]|uniref:hypothetical protein n=1 Tax=Halomonas heilongjiangensis TaxID=1387883 RepID=UPI000D757E36|nr:hypothetical protein [Halomonas heilongjiangensis]PXX89997.1 hypothetical protein CR158_10475 [Halomonas heilongjiangensis]